MSQVISFEFTVIDGKKLKSSITLYTFTVGALTTEEMNQIAIAALPVLRNIIYGGIIGCRIGFQADLASLFTSFPSLQIPEDYADCEEGGKFTWICEGDTNPRMIQRIPTFDESCLLVGTRNVDPDNLQIIPFVDMMTQFIETPIDTYNFTNHEGSAIAQFSNGIEDFRPRRKNRRKKR